MFMFTGALGIAVSGGNLRVQLDLTDFKDFTLFWVCNFGTDRYYLSLLAQMQDLFCILLWKNCKTIVVP